MKKVKYIFSIFSFCFVLFSCEKEQYKRTYYDNGVLKEKRLYLKEELKQKHTYDSIGNISKSIHYSSGKIDSLLSYNKNKKLSFKKVFSGDKYYYISYKDGIVSRKGYIKNDSLKLGWWEYFDNGVLKSKREYIIPCKDYVLNQSIIFDKNRDTVFRDDDFNESSFYDFRVTDLKNGRLKVDYHIVPVSNRSFLQVGIINKDNFCVVEEKDIDTAINLSSRKGSFIVKKNKYNKGMIVDYRTTEKGVELKEGVSTLSRRMFFDLDDYVVKNMNK